MVDFVQSIIDRVWLRLANLIEKNQLKAIASIRVIGNDGDTNGVQLTTVLLCIFSLNIFRQFQFFFELVRSNYSASFCTFKCRA